MHHFRVFIVLLVIYLSFVNGDEHNHVYEVNEEVVLWLNTVGPYHNGEETHSNFILSICASTRIPTNPYYDTPFSIFHSLGETLQGSIFIFSGLDLHFKDDIYKKSFCLVNLNEEKFKAFIYAIQNHHWYQMYIDDLPIWGIVGEVDEINNKYYIWTHKKFDIGYNKHHIVDVNFTSEAKVEIKLNATIEFTYEVHWKPSHIIYKERFNKYLEPEFIQHGIHWFSNFNGFIVVLFLAVLVFMILLQTVRKDYTRYSQDEEAEVMKKKLGVDYGWKQVHGDVFRPASYPMFFSAIIGCGHQITLVTFLVITFTIVEDLYTERGSLLGTPMFVYAVTSPVNGYFGGSLYAKMGGRIWIRQILLSALLLPSLVCSMTFLLSCIAIYCDSIGVITFGSLVRVAHMCIFVILPLTLIGSLLGRNLSGQPDYPCRVNAVPRSIPEKKWFMKPLIITMFGGILPFGSIFIEIYYIFTSFWAYKLYYIYGINGFMLLTILTLMVVTVCVSIICTYFLLNAEDYRWQWTSFAAAASTAFYVYLYSFYYFIFKTKMYGLFQTAFYFGYMALFSIALGIMCGTAGYIGTHVFVCKMYTSVKS